MPANQVKSVTRDNWSVSTISGRHPGSVVLSVRRTGMLGKETLHIEGDADGRRFPTVAAAFAYALDRGYLQPHVRRVWCRACRCQHTSGGKASAFCPVQGIHLG